MDQAFVDAIADPVNRLWEWIRRSVDASADPVKRYEADMRGPVVW